MSGAVIIRGEAMEQHDVRAAPWTIAPAAVLHRQLLALGTVERLDRLQGALELARREGAAQALEAAAAEWRQAVGLGYSTTSAWLEQRAELHRTGQL